MSSIRKQANYVRVGNVVKEVFAVCLRNELARRIPPADLQAKLNEMSGKKQKKLCLTEDEMNVIERAILDNCYGEFDFSLSYKLLRNMFPLTKYATPEDRQFFEDIQEMRKIRNKWFAHLQGNKIEDHEFSMIMKTSEEICNRMKDEEQYIMIFGNIKQRQVLITHDSTSSCDGEKLTQEFNRKSLIISSWEEDDKKYYETSGCKYTERLIEVKAIVTIVGPSGCGKSSMAQHIALKYKQQGWMIMPVSNINEFYGLVNPNTPFNQMYVLHDPLGKDSINECLLRDSMQNENLVAKFLESKRVKLIVTTRVAILNDKRCMKLFQANIVPLHEKFLLSKDEKKCIFLQHVPDADSFSMEEKELILKSEHYFPLLCSLFGRNERYRRKGSTFFTEPVSEISNEIAYFKINDRLAYLSLILLLSTKGNLERNMSNIKDDIFIEVCELCCVDRNTPRRLVVEKLESMVDILVRKETGNYLFCHDFIMDVVAYTVASEFPDLLIKICPLSILRNRIFLASKIIQKNDPEFKIYLSDEYADALADRYFAEMSNNFTDVVLSPSFDYYKVKKIFMKRISNMDDIHFQEMFLTTTHHEQSSIHILYKAAFANNKYVQAILDTFLHVKTQPLSELSTEKILAQEKMKEEKKSSFNSSTISLQKILESLKIEKLGSEQDSDKESESVIEKILESLGIDMLLRNIECPNPKYFKKRIVLICANVLKLIKTITNEPDLMENWKGFLIKVGRILLDAIPPDTPVKGFSNMSIRILLNVMREMEGKNFIIHWLRNISAETVFQIVSEYHNCWIMTLNKITPDLRQRIWSILKDNKTVVETILVPTIKNFFSKGSSGPIKSSLQPIYAMFIQMLEMYKIQASRAKELCLIRELDKNLSATQTNKNNLALLAHEVSPIQMFIIYSNRKIIEALLTRVERMENGKAMISKNIFLAACLNGSVEIARLILEFMGESVLHQQWYCNNCFGLNAVQIAALLHHSEMTAFLLEYKFSVNAIDGLGRTPLMLAISSFHKGMSDSDRQRGFDTLEVLFKHGARISVRNIYGATAFHSACEFICDRNIFEFFLNENVNNLMDKSISPLMLAAKNGNTDVVRLLLNQHAVVNHHDEAGHSPIFYACYSGSIETVICILEQGANPDDTDNMGVSPLMAAALNGHDEVVRLLTEVCRVDRTDTNLNTAMHFAATKGHLNVVKTLCKNGASVNLVNAGFETPVFSAVSNEHYMVTNELINLGADINICSKTGKSPLMLAALKNHIHLTELLLDNGSNIDAEDIYMRTSLWYSAAQGNEEITLLLLHKKADVKICDKFGFTPLAIAAKYGKLKTVSLMYHQGSDINKCTEDHDTPLILAAAEGHNEVVCFLLSHHADINALNKRNENALWAASANGHVDIVKLLVDEGANITQNINGKDPLYEASEKGFADIVEYLLFSENTSHMRVHDALCVACLRGQTFIVEIFIEANTDINMQDKKGKTALWHAVDGENIELINLLLNNNANVNIPNDFDMTPLFLASVKRHGKIIVKLLRKGAHFSKLIEIISLNKTESMFCNDPSQTLIPPFWEFLTVNNVLNMMTHILSGQINEDANIDPNSFSLFIMNFLSYFKKNG